VGIFAAMKIRLLLFFLIMTTYTVSRAQILTKEDSLAAGLTMTGKTTVLSGYGEMMLTYNNGTQTANANVTRFVTFMGHRFSKKVTLFSELELENAKISKGSSGEFSIEQAFIKFDINRSSYIIAGLFIPRIGIINENHLPTTYNGNRRHYVESQLIPSTWREIGVGLYGRFDRLPGFNYYLGLTNGLNSAGFTRQTGIREGRYEGNNATATNLAVSAAGLYYYRDFRFQASAYYGGSAGLTPKAGDSLQLNTGPFGTPVMLSECNIQYTGKRFGFKTLGTIINISDAYNISRAYNNNVAQQMMGAFAEINYQFLNTGDVFSRKLIGFARYEWYDLNYKMASNGIKDNALNCHFLVTGITYKPVLGVAIKADVVNRVSGTPNPVFNNPPVPQAPLYLTNNWFYHLGLAYNF